MIRGLGNGGGAKAKLITFQHPTYDQGGGRDNNEHRYLATSLNAVVCHAPSRRQRLNVWMGQIGRYVPFDGDRHSAGPTNPKIRQS